MVRMWDWKVSKYFEYLCKFDIVTLPHIGGSEIFLATKVATMTLKIILCQCLSKCISNLVLRAYGKDLDKSLAYVFAKMVVTYVDVLGSGT